MLTVTTLPDPLINFTGNEIIVAGITDIYDADNQDYYFNIVVTDKDSNEIINVDEKSFNSGFSVNLSNLLKNKIPKLKELNNIPQSLNINNVGDDFLYVFYVSINGSYGTTNDINKYDFSDIPFYLINGIHPFLSSPQAGFLNNSKSIYNIQEDNIENLFFLCGSIKGDTKYNTTNIELKKTYLDGTINTTDIPVSLGTQDHTNSNIDSLLRSVNVKKLLEGEISLSKVKFSTVYNSVEIDIINKTPTDRCKNHTFYYMNKNGVFDSLIFNKTSEVSTKIDRNIIVNGDIESVFDVESEQVYKVFSDYANDAFTRKYFELITSKEVFLKISDTDTYFNVVLVKDKDTLKNKNKHRLFQYEISYKHNKKINYLF